MEKKMTESLADSEDMESELQSESRTFDEVLDVPIVQLPEIPINFPYDVSPAPVLERENVSKNADAEFTAPAQAPKNKKTNKRKKKGRSSGRPVESKFVRV
jgi:hypothetical protein